MAYAITKLRRATRAPSRALAPTVVDRILWRGISLNELGAALSRTHHVKYVWKQLAITVSLALEDHAVAFIQAGTLQDKPILLAEDGLHDELSRAISSADVRCPFLQAPAEHINNLALTLANDENARLLYEFIEHYWGWKIVAGKESPVYLMVFGPEASPPHRLALDACRLASFVANHVGSEKQRRQLISELSAETQGKRITPAVALKNRLDQWVKLNDGTK